MSARSQYPLAQPREKVVTAPPKAPVDEGRLRQLTAQIAYELYEKRGKTHGKHEQDWLEAEKVARERLAKS